MEMVISSLLDQARSIFRYSPGLPVKVVPSPNCTSKSWHHEGTRNARRKVAALFAFKFASAVGASGQLAFPLVASFRLMDIFVVPDPMVSATISRLTLARLPSLVVILSENSPELYIRMAKPLSANFVQIVSGIVAMHLLTDDRQHGGASP